MKTSNLFKSAAVSLLAVSVFALAACSAKEESSATTVEVNISSTAGTAANSGAETTTAAKTDENTIYGKVTAINDKIITIAIGTMKTQRGRPDNMPSDNSNAPQETMPSGNQQGTPPSGGMPELLTLTGNSKTITVTDSVKITKLNMLGQFGRPSDQQNTATTSDSAATVDTTTFSDISVGSILKITTKTGTETVNSIEIISMNLPDGFNPGGQTEGSTSMTP